MPDEGDRPVEMLATIRAEIAESTVKILTLRQQDTNSALDAERGETARLRELIGREESELVSLRTQLQAALDTNRHMALGTLISSVVAAIDEGARHIEDRTIAAAQAEIKVGLALVGGAIAVTSRPDQSDTSLSTIRLDVRPLPPSAEKTAIEGAAAEVRDALTELQVALDHDVPVAARGAAGAASARVAALLAALPDAGALGAATAPLVDQLKTLGTAIPGLVAAVTTLDRARAGLASPADPTSLRIFADAIRTVAAHLAAV